MLPDFTPKVRKLVAANGGEQGPRGPAAPTGPPGGMGAAGPEGKAAPGSVLTYSSTGDGQPLVLASEDGSTQESIGPLTFSASCEPDGEDPVRGMIEVRSSEDGVTLNGEPLNQGATVTLQDKTVS